MIPLGSVAVVGDDCCGVSANTTVEFVVDAVLDRGKVVGVSCTVSSPKGELMIAPSRCAQTARYSPVGRREERGLDAYPSPYE